MVGIALVVALAAGLGTGYLHWGWPTNWYARDVTSLPASPENDIIRYGHSLISWLNSAGLSSGRKWPPRSSVVICTPGISKRS